MALLAPYHDAMKLGSGFNSFTQEICLDGAVVRDDGSAGIQLEGPDHAKNLAPVAQSVTYKTSIIDKISDVLDTLNINAAASVKFGKGSIGIGADVVNESKIKNADLTYMVSCKVVNQIKMDTSLTRFTPVPGLPPADFTRVYGDSFISGFQEGGEFTAIISIRAKDRTQANTIKADASVSFTLEKASGAVDAGLDKIKKDILAENETTVSVSWTGGGQGLKNPEDDWTFDTMRAVALKYPDLVARCPMRTQAVLTKYSSLKSFHAASLQYKFNPLSYDNARVYTAALRDAFLDYQNISKTLSVLALDTNAGTVRLVAQDKLEKNFAQNTLKASKPSLLENIMSETQTDSFEKDVGAKETPIEKAPTTTAATPVSEAKTPDSASEDGVVIGNEDGKDAAPDEAAPTPHKGSEAMDPLVIDKPYPPTIYGLESARMQCRFMMNRIVAEVDTVSNHPEIAMDENRPLPYMSPFLFNMLLPAGVPAI